MRIKSYITLVAMGVGGTLIYQNIKNGKIPQMMNKMKNEAQKTLNNLEDMM